ncbi:GDSL-type esterase/lipase family protein [Acinetobacter sp. ANC 3882]|uniref:GDSL-type esterase/lipase family protein n=1 Tax=Acinetobacter sp. ANC 3882 TaxID=2923423 RepID=UPI001F4B31F0|nr:GDSL-type esterase/lipase family protein [Acinetobacter sp. ANC 3882]MCH7312916.1 GDSL-type esterase/lipase family protein [Acinetobacter sp. ANC 3882]
MTNLVISPHVPFIDIDGSPLNEGFIFVGEKDKDPQVFPVSVYWDEAKTLPAVQPIRTRNGFVVNEGVISKIFIDQSNCSIAIKNRNQSIIHTELNSIQFSSVAGAQGLIQVETTRAMAAESALNTSIINEATRATTAEALLQTQINTNGVGNRAYLTYAAMVADKVNIPAKSKVTVTNDSTPANNGDYQYDGTNFTKSIYDPVQQAKDYADANKYFKPVIFELTSDLNNFTTGGVWFAPTSSYAALERNFPIVSGGWLTVIDSSNNQKYQRYDTHEYSFLRRLNSGVWSPWITQDMTKAINTASNYTDSKFSNAVGYDQSNLMAGNAIIADKYVNSSGVVTAQVATAYMAIPVTVGSYYFKNYGADLVAGSFPVGFSTTANATTYTILTRTVVSAGVLRVDVAEAGYLAFDLKLANTNFISTLHVTSNLLAVDKHAIKINGADLIDQQLRLTAFTTDNMEAIGNLYNPSTNKPDVYVHVSGSIATASGALLTQIKVQKGVTYHIKAPDLRGGIFAVALRADASMAVGPTLGLATLTTVSATYKTFTIPVDSLAEYALLTVKLPSLSFDISTTIQILNPTPDTPTLKKVNKLNGISLAASTLNKLTGKKWIAIGDSITEKNFRANKNYHDFISEDVGGMTVYNKGISGSGFWNRLNVADTLTEEADIITLFWGVNDFSKTYPMGPFLSNDTETLSGRMNYVINSLLVKYPLAKLAILTPIPALSQWGSNATPNSLGFTLKDICDMLVKYAKHYSLPVLNQYETSNLPVWVPAANNYYFTAPGQPSPDGLHPNDAGQRVMADHMKVFLESL